MARSEVSVSAVDENKEPFSYPASTNVDRFIPTVAFLRSDKNELSGLIGADAIAALRQPSSQREIIDAGYGNFRRQPKRDIVLDSDDNEWIFTRKKKFGEERISCDTAIREFFRALFGRLGEDECQRAYEQPLYIGKPAYSEPGLEGRLILGNQSPLICSFQHIQSLPIPEASEED